VKQSCRREIVFTTDPTRWPPRVEGVLFCWEAFVSQGAHADTHLKDAATAVVEFFKHEAHLAACNSVSAENPLSLIGAAALWAGLADDLTLLHQPAVVIRPVTPFGGIVRELPGASTHATDPSGERR